jgi:uncharacterized protein YbaR (Trm112 family)/SAM-dependent methyltransferase
MKERLLDFLACPHDQHHPLQLHTFRERPRPGQAADLTEGVLLCDECKRWFPITDGIPTVFPDDLRGPGPSGYGDDEFIAVHRDELAAMRLVGPAASLSTADRAAEEEIRKMQSERRARDEQAEQYDKLLGLRLYKWIEAPAYYEALSGAPPGPLLEAGCGTGRLTDVFTSIADEVIAADFSLISIRRNRARHASNSKIIHYVQCDLTRLPLRDSCVTAIAHAGVYEHIPSRDARLRWLQHARRVLMPGGKAMISAYRYGGLICRMLWTKEGEHAGGIPFIRFTEDELKAELNESFIIQRFTPNLGIYLSMAQCQRRG